MTGANHGFNYKRNMQIVTEPKGIDMKLRAAFLFPTLAIGVALILVDVFAVDFLPHWAYPLMALPGLISLIVVERKRSRRSSKYLRTSPPRDWGPA